MFYQKYSQLNSNHQDITILPTNIKQAAFRGQKRLLLSDNPEDLNNETFAQDNIILWHDCVKGTNKVFHRVYAWHVNHTGKKIKIGVTIENLSSTGHLNICNFKHEVKRVLLGNLYITHVGRPLASINLANALKSAKPINQKVQHQGLIQEYKADYGELVGIVQEFEVSGSCSELNYYLRVVASKDLKEDLRCITSGLAENDGLHYRGSWEYADIVACSEKYNLENRMLVSISNGKTDNLQRKENSFDSVNATHNPGHYGSKIKVQIPVVNYYKCVKTVQVGINPRGGEYAGAVKLPVGVFDIPLLDTKDKNFACLLHHLAPPGISTIEFEIMHAGAASLPVAISLQSI